MIFEIFDLITGDLHGAPVVTNPRSDQTANDIGCIAYQTINGPVIIPKEVGSKNRNPEICLSG
jgi:hypothetical protein